MYIKNPKATSEEQEGEVDYFREAVAEARAGKKDIARYLLRKATDRDSNNEKIWLWRASLARNLEEAIVYIEKVLRIDPSNEKASGWLARARKANRPPPATWQCRLCEQTSAKQHGRCPHCGAIPALDDLEAIARNDDVNQEILKQAIKRLRLILREGPNFDASLGLGIAYLNLKRSSEAVLHLREACRLQPHAEGLQQTLDGLLTRKLILLVDHSWTLQQSVSTALDQEGFRVRLAANGIEALAIVDEDTPDLILLATTMPHFDGYEICRMLRRNAATRDIPVILLSEQDGFWSRIRGRFAGAHDSMVKPFEPTALLQKLEEALPGQNAAAPPAKAGSAGAGQPT